MTQTKSSVAMTSSLPSTPATQISLYQLPDIRGFPDMGNTDTLTRSPRNPMTYRGRGTSLERTDKERRLQDQSMDLFSSPCAQNPGDTALSRPPLSDDPHSSDDFEDENAGPRARYRSWRGDHVSPGSEKIWSIGHEESDENQDGQVEKSITEALTGVGPNPRSRKASHSLRFFKEGLPEDKTKRKELRLGPHFREKLHAYTEEQKFFDEWRDQVQSVVKQSNHVVDVGPGVSRAQSFPHEVRMKELSHTDHFKQVNHKPRTPPQSPQLYKPVNGPEPPSKTLGRPIASALGAANDAEITQTSGINGVEELTDGDGGDDSGEEKVSSAVFVPHQTADDEVRDPTTPTSAYHPHAVAAKPRAHSRVEDYHPWLVRTDEPEHDLESAEEGLDKQPLFILDQNRHSLYEKGEDVAVEDDRDSVRSTQHFTSRPTSQVFEDHVHDHQIGVREPLEAIALKPYKHQVGGHTTIWRFSRRAVCKKLNNRENEFYEAVERWHRDLLPFLPR